MTPEAFEAHCLSLPAAAKVIQWGGSSVYKLGPQGVRHRRPRPRDGPPAYTFKVSDIAYELLIEHGFARPAPYLRAGQMGAADGARTHSATRTCAPIWIRPTPWSPPG